MLQRLFEKLFKKEKAELLKTEKIKEQKSEEKGRISGIIEPEETKYGNVIKAVDLLLKEGFENFVAKTYGETSSHDWCYGFNRTYGSMEEFLLNSEKDFKEESAKNKNGPNCEWDLTGFYLSKKAEADTIYIRIIIAENGYPDYNAAWNLSFPKKLENSEIILSLKEKLENL